ncbi:hypothetical protein D9M68_522510 [compost metagenome]
MRGQLGHLLAVRGIVGLRKGPRHVDRRLRGVVERTLHAQHFSIAQAAGFGEPAQRRVVTQRGGGEDPGAAAVFLRRRRDGAVLRVFLVVAVGQVGLHGLVGQLEHPLAHRIGDVERRLDQPQLRADIDPAHRVEFARLRETRRALGELARALVQAHEVGRDLAHRVQPVGGQHEGVLQVVERALPGLGIHALGRGTDPAQLGARPLLADHQAQLTRRTLDPRHQLLPVDQPARMLQARAEHVAREIERLPAAELRAQELHAGLVELVRLVEHDDAHGRQQLGHAGLAHREVGKEQVVVDDHDVGRQRLAPRQVDVAGLELRALRAQAVLARGSGQRDQRRTFVEPRQFGEVTGARGFRPLLDLCQRAQAAALGQRGVVARHVEPMQAQVAAPPFQQRRAYRQCEGLDEARQVAAEQLVLQGLGGGREQHALAAQQRRHEVREGLAHAGAGLDHEHAAVGDGAGHGHRHLGLAAAFAELLGGLRQHPVLRERIAHLVFERRRHAGSFGSSAFSSWAIWSRRARRRFFRRRISSSSCGVPSSESRSMVASRSACAMRSSIS